MRGKPLGFSKSLGVGFKGKADQISVSFSIGEGNDFGAILSEKSSLHGWSLTDC